MRARVLFVCEGDGEESGCYVTETNFITYHQQIKLVKTGYKRKCATVHGGVGGKCHIAAIFFFDSQLPNFTVYLLY